MSSVERTVVELFIIVVDNSLLFRLFEVLYTTISKKYHSRHE